jgi:peptidoglycan/LPS O-acetylase OafA/YrhL
MSDPRIPEEYRISCLDGFRGLLAIWVFLGHLAGAVGFTFPILSRPGLAVDFFMILSGFLMQWHWMPRNNTSLAQQSLTFYSRRFFRIAPLYYIALTTITVFHDGLSTAKSRIQNVFHPQSEITAILGSSSDQAINIDSLVAHTLFFFGVIPEYAQNHPLPDWSISLEMQFYLVFPLLVMLLQRTGPILLAVILFPVSIICLKLFGTPNDPGLLLTYPQPSFLPMRLGVFVAGMFLAKVL